MNQDRIAGICKQFSGTLRKNWGQWTNNPRAVTAGTRKLLEGRMQEHYGASKEEAARQLREFLTRNRRWDLTNR